MHRLSPAAIFDKPLSGNHPRAGGVWPRWIAVVLAFAAGIPPLAAQGAASSPADGSRIHFPNSLAPLPSGASVTMIADSEPVGFRVALRMTDGAYPPAADYLALADWLKAQGFTLAGVDPALRMSIDARGTVAQARAALQIRFGWVVVDGKGYAADVDDPPSLPASVGRVVLGINGLQPFLHMNKGPVAAHSHLAVPSGH